jgi:3-methylfumaryl-CoA hydratase
MMAGPSVSRVRPGRAARDGPLVTQVSVDPFPVAALAALFDDGLAAPGPGEPLPPYWHLAACAVPLRTGVLGADGHPGDGPVSAPPGLPRRMFAGGRLDVCGQARIGERLGREARVVRTEDKQGRSGPLRFVTVASWLRRDTGEVVLAEEQDLVYRAAAGTGPGTPAAGGPVAGVAGPVAGPPPAAAPGTLLTRDGPLRATLRADAVALHRFSAATSNPHRIHYDHPYATSVAGYPGLVVHGPLLLLSLLELVRLDHPERTVAAVSFRARAPVFAGEPVRLAAEEAAGGVLHLSARAAGPTAMTCEVTFGPG